MMTADEPMHDHRASNAGIAESGELGTLEAAESAKVQRVSEAPPSALVVPRPAPQRSKWWWLVIASCLITLSLFLYSRRFQGAQIVVEFNEGHGIKPEDRLKHHGIDIGEVERVELTHDLNKVLVHIRLYPNASSIAREGASFWIVRPMLSIDSIKGLETIVGAKFLAVQPPPSSSKPAHRFRGLEEPPLSIAQDGSLEVLLDGATRGGLTNGAPILYRGYKIGKVVQVGLAADARSVRARCAIDPEYRDLVRANTKFWNRSGWRLNVGLTGVKVDADSVSQILAGGIEMATPDAPDVAVSTGHRFLLHDEAKPEWTQWQPSIGHGEQWTQMEGRLPQPQRMAIRWQERSFGFRTNRQISGWCLPLDDGSVLCLKEQIVAPEKALAGSISIEFAGLATQPDSIELVQPGNRPPQDPRIVRFKSRAALPAEVSLWPAASIVAAPKEPTNVVLALDDSRSAIVVDAGRLTSEGTVWTIDKSTVLTGDVLGAPVVQSETKQVIGLVVSTDGEAIVVLLQ